MVVGNWLVDMCSMEVRVAPAAAVDYSVEDPAVQKTAGIVDWAEIGIDCHWTVADFVDCWLSVDRRFDKESGQN